MITSISHEITGNIVKEMKEAKMYSLMADEARDGHTEQLAVCVCFVSCKGHFKECFRGLRKLERFALQTLLRSCCSITRSVTYFVLHNPSSQKSSLR